jgi:hypothetical protein
VKKNAVAGHSFASWEAFEAHLAKWEREVANVRSHGTTGEAPIVRLQIRLQHAVTVIRANNRSLLCPSDAGSLTHGPRAGSRRHAVGTPSFKGITQIAALRDLDAHCTTGRLNLAHLYHGTGTARIAHDRQSPDRNNGGENRHHAATVRLAGEISSASQHCGDLSKDRGRRRP